MAAGIVKGGSAKQQQGRQNTKALCTISKDINKMCKFYFIVIPYFELVHHVYKKQQNTFISVVVT